MRVSLRPIVALPFVPLLLAEPAVAQSSCSSEQLRNGTCVSRPRGLPPTTPPLPGPYSRPLEDNACLDSIKNPSQTWVQINVGQGPGTLGPGAPGVREDKGFFLRETTLQFMGAVKAFRFEMSSVQFLPKIFVFLPDGTLLGQSVPTGNARDPWGNQFYSTQHPGLPSSARRYYNAAIEFPTTAFVDYQDPQDCTFRWSLRVVWTSALPNVTGDYFAKTVEFDLK